jgi:hypothetical protein
MNELVISKMLAVMAHGYSKCTYQVSGFHAAFGDKLQLTENWRSLVFVLPLQTLNSNCRSMARVRLVNMALLTVQRQFCK